MMNVATENQNRESKLVFETLSLLSLHEAEGLSFLKMER
jgi:hypothetical protein